jgi:hypothetical protein
MTNELDNKIVIRKYNLTVSQVVAGFVAMILMLAAFWMTGFLVGSWSARQEMAPHRGLQVGAGK